MGAFDKIKSAVNKAIFGNKDDDEKNKNKTSPVIPTKAPSQPTLKTGGSNSALKTAVNKAASALQTKATSAPKTTAASAFTPQKTGGSALNTAPSAFTPTTKPNQTLLPTNRSNQALVTTVVNAANKAKDELTKRKSLINTAAFQGNKNADTTVMQTLKGYNVSVLNGDDKGSKAKGAAAFIQGGEVYGPPNPNLEPKRNTINPLNESDRNIMNSSDLKWMEHMDEQRRIAQQDNHAALAEHISDLMNNRRKKYGYNALADTYTSTALSADEDERLSARDRRAIKEKKEEYMKAYGERMKAVADNDTSAIDRAEKIMSDAHKDAEEITSRYGLHRGESGGITSEDYSVRNSKDAPLVAAAKSPDVDKQIENAMLDGNADYAARLTAMKNATPTQQRQYNYLYEKDNNSFLGNVLGNGKAEEYLRTNILANENRRTAEQNAQMQEAENKRIDREGSTAERFMRGVTATVAPALTNPTVGAINTVNNIYEAVRYGNVDPYSTLNQVSETAAKERQRFADSIDNTALRIGYEAGASAMDSIVSMLGGGPVLGLAAMSSGAANQTLLSDIEQGKDITDSVLHAAGVGLIEAASEYIPFKRLGKVVGGSLPKGHKFVPAFKEIAAGMLEEGAGEGAGAIGEAVLDDFIFGQNSDKHIRERELMEQGVSKEEAEKQAMIETYVIEPLENFAMGALSGGMMIGGGTIIGHLNKASRPASEDATIQNILYSGQLLENSIGKKLADKVLEDYNGKGASKKDLAELEMYIRQEAFDRVNDPKNRDKINDYFGFDGEKESDNRLVNAFADFRGKKLGQYAENKFTAALSDRTQTLNNDMMQMLSYEDPQSMVAAYRKMKPRLNEYRDNTIDLYNSGVLSANAEEYVGETLMRINEVEKQLDALGEKMPQTVTISEPETPTAEVPTGVRRGDNTLYHKSALQNDDVTDRIEQSGITDDAYDIVSVNDTTGDITLTKTDDFNGKSEPRVVSRTIIKSDGTIENVPINNKEIIPDKSEYVPKNYTGFDVNAQREHENSWRNSGVNYSPTKINDEDYFNGKFGKILEAKQKNEASVSSVTNETEVKDTSVAERTNIAEKKPQSRTTTSTAKPTENLPDMGNAEEILTHMGRDGEKIFRNTFGDRAKNGSSVEQQTAALYYAKGRENPEMSFADLDKTTPKHGKLSEEQRRAFFEAGVKDGIGIRSNRSYSRNGVDKKSNGYAKARKLTTSATMRKLDMMGKVLGVQIQFVTRIPDKPANIQGMMADNKGILYINVSSKGLDPVSFIAMHESVHRLRTVDPASYDKLRNYIVDHLSDKTFQQGIGLKKSEYEERVGKALDDIEAEEEFIANVAARMLMSEPLTVMFAEEHRSVLQKIVDFFNDILTRIHLLLNRDYMKVGSLTEAEVAALSELEADINDLQYLYSGALDQALSKQLDEAGAEATDSLDARYSISSLFTSLGLESEYRQEDGVYYRKKGDENWERVGKGKEFTVEELEGSPVFKSIDMATEPISNKKYGEVNAPAITKEEAKEQKQNLVTLLNMIIKTQDPEMVWNFMGANMFNHFTANNDKQYNKSVEMGTICRKTQAIMDIMSAMMMERKRGLTPDEIVDIVYKDLAKNHFIVPCGQCYVFSRWVGVGNTLQTMWDNQYEFMADYVTDKELEEAGLDPKDPRLKARYTDERIAELGKWVNGDITEVKKKDPDMETDKAKKILFKQYEKELKKLKKKGEDLTDINDKIKVLSNLSWFNKTRCQTGKNAHKWKLCPAKYLFDLNAADTMVSEYPATWNYRVTRGAGAGKLAVGYTEAQFGRTLQSLSVGSGSLKNLPKKTNPFMRGTYSPSTFNKIRKYVRAQNLYGGLRVHSSSDFRMDNALDYVLLFNELQLAHSKVQTYTKAPEEIVFFATAGADINISLIGKGDGLLRDKNGKLIRDENGNPILDFDPVQGVDIDIARYFADKYDSVQTILVGMNDEHIKTALGSDLVDFVIPWHSSGGTKKRLASMLGMTEKQYEQFEKNTTDYTDFQEDKTIENPTAEQKEARDFRTKLLTGKETWSEKTYKEWLEKNSVLAELYARFYKEGYDPSTYHAFVSNDQAKLIMPYEYWIKSFEILKDGTRIPHTIPATKENGFVPATRAEASLNNERFFNHCETIGYTPRFSFGDGDFSKEENYWKLLIDRPMYDLEGNYREQREISMNGFNPELLDPRNYEQGSTNEATKEVRELFKERGHRVGRSGDVNRATTGEFSKETKAIAAELNKKIDKVRAESKVESKEKPLDADSERYSVAFVDWKDPSDLFRNMKDKNGREMLNFTIKNIEKVLKDNGYDEGDIKLLNLKKLSTNGKTIPRDTLLDFLEDQTQTIDDAVSLSMRGVHRIDSDYLTPKQNGHGKNISRHIDTVNNSIYIGEDVVLDTLDDAMRNGRYTYTPVKNEDSIKYADKVIKDNGVKGAIAIFEDSISAHKIPTADTVALGERLLQDLSKNGYTKEYARLLGQVSAIGSELAQSLQAMSIVNRFGGEAKRAEIERKIDSYNYEHSEWHSSKGKDSLRGVKNQNAQREINQLERDHNIQQTIEAYEDGREFKEVVEALKDNAQNVEDANREVKEARTGLNEAMAEASEYIDSVAADDGERVIIQRNINEQRELTEVIESVDERIAIAETEIEARQLELDGLEDRKTKLTNELDRLTELADEDEYSRKRIRELRSDISAIEDEIQRVEADANADSIYDMSDEIAELEDKRDELVQTLNELPIAEDRDMLEELQTQFETDAEKLNEKLDKLKDENNLHPNEDLTAEISRLTEEVVDKKRQINDIKKGVKLAKEIRELDRKIRELMTEEKTLPYTETDLQILKDFKKKLQKEKNALTRKIKSLTKLTEQNIDKIQNLEKEIVKRRQEYQDARIYAKTVAGVTKMLMRRYNSILTRIKKNDAATIGILDRFTESWMTDKPKDKPKKSEVEMASEVLGAFRPHADPEQIPDFDAFKESVLEDFRKAEADLEKSAADRKKLQEAKSKLKRMHKGLQKSIEAQTKALKRDKDIVQNLIDNYGKEVAEATAKPEKPKASVKAGQILDELRDSDFPDLAGDLTDAEYYKYKALTLKAFQVAEQQLDELKAERERIRDVEKRIRTIQNEMQGRGVIKAPTTLMERLAIETDPEMIKKFEDMIYKNIAHQIKPSLGQTLNAWRYLSMLGNVRTHIRNILGNTLMTMGKVSKDIMATGMEHFLIKDGQRTKGFNAKEWRELKDFARNDLKEMLSILKGNGKYEIQEKIRDEIQYFRGIFKPIQAAYNFNNKALDFEDTVFLGFHYKNALKSYLIANHVTANDLQVMNKQTEETLQKARAYAIREAQKATFRDESAVAREINKLSRRNPVSHFIVEAIMPFKGVPINITKRAIEYSPIGYAIAAMDALKAGGYLEVKDYDRGDFNKGRVADDVAAATVGTVMLMLGVYLFRAGLLWGNGDDDDAAKYLRKAMGQQDFSIKIGDNSYTINWAAPLVVPMFAGASLEEALENAAENDGSVDSDAVFNIVIDTLASAADPVMEMTVLSGFNDLMENIQRSNDGYDEDKKINWGTALAESVTWNYLSQFVPTLSGQISNIVEQDARSTYYDQSSPMNTLRQKGIQKILNKIPGLRPMAKAIMDSDVIDDDSRMGAMVDFIYRNAGTEYLDSWGENVSGSDSWIMRTLYNMFSPGYAAVLKDDAVGREIVSLYDRLGYEDGEKAIPPRFSGRFNIENEDGSTTPRTLTRDEWENAEKYFGTQAHTFLNGFIRSSSYKSMTDLQKAKALQSVYTYITDKTMDRYFANEGYKEKGLTTQIKENEKAGVSPTETIVWHAITGKDQNAKFIQDAKASNLDPAIYQRVKDSQSAKKLPDFEKAKTMDLIANMESYGLTKETVMAYDSSLKETYKGGSAKGYTHFDWIQKQLNAGVTIEDYTKYKEELKKLDDEYKNDDNPDNNNDATHKAVKMAVAKRVAPDHWEALARLDMPSSKI